jgi:predicted nucleotidyltransferase
MAQTSTSSHADVNAPAIRAIAQRHGVTHIRVFGSVVRGESRPGSDLDLLVDLEPGRSILDLIAVKQDLEDFLGRTVDVVTERSLSPYFREAVLKEAVPL